MIPVKMLATQSKSLEKYVLKYVYMKGTKHYLVILFAIKAEFAVQFQIERLGEHRTLYESLPLGPKILSRRHLFPPCVSAVISGHSLATIYHSSCLY